MVMRGPDVVEFDGWDQQSTLDNYERVLDLAAERMGVAKVTVTKAKEWMRSFGASGARCASQLSKLSKMRNGAAHPFVAQLIASLSALGCAGSEEKADQVEAQIGRDSFGYDKVKVGSGVAAKDGFDSTKAEEPKKEKLQEMHDLDSCGYDKVKVGSGVAAKDGFDTDDSTCGSSEGGGVTLRALGFDDDDYGMMSSDVVDCSDIIDYEEFKNMMANKIKNRDPRKAFRLFDDFDGTGKRPLKHLKRAIGELKTDAGLQDIEDWLTGVTTGSGTIGYAKVLKFGRTGKV